MRKSHRELEHSKKLAVTAKSGVAKRHSGQRVTPAREGSPCKKPSEQAAPSLCSALLVPPPPPSSAAPPEHIRDCSHPHPGVEASQRREVARSLAQRGCRLHRERLRHRHLQRELPAGRPFSDLARRKERDQEHARSLLCRGLCPGRRLNRTVPLRRECGGPSSDSGRQISEAAEETGFGDAQGFGGLHGLALDRRGL
ncbi:hypothetical protein ABZP36_019597 [Zizania latifolia]